jgi:uncharacterized protein (AIM24 family)
MRYDIQGELMQTLETYLAPGESIFTEAGGMAWMRGNVAMDSGTKGGLMKGLGRALAGESLFMTTYTCNSGEGMVAFSPEVPGKILDIKLAAGQSLICQTDCKLVAINQKRFRFLVEQTPNFAIEVMTIMAERLDRMNQTSPA